MRPPPGANRAAASLAHGMSSMSEPIKSDAGTADIGKGRETTAMPHRLRPSARDSLPGHREALPAGSLGGAKLQPQGDENREPPANAPAPPP